MMSNNNNPELKTWFDDALKQGHTIDELIPHLKEHGYTDEMIDPVVSQLKAELDQNTVIQNTEEPQQSQEAPSDQTIEADFSENQDLDQKEIPNDQPLEEDQILEENNDNQEIQENTENVNVIENLDDEFDISKDDSEEQNQESGELTLEEIEAELDAQTKDMTQKKSKNLIKPLISIVVLIAVLIGGYAAYPKVINLIKSFTQSTPKAAPPTLPGNSFDTPSENPDLVDEEIQLPTSLNEEKTEIEEQTSQSGQKLRRFKKELYFE